MGHSPAIKFADLCRNLTLDPKFVAKYIKNMAVLNKRHPEYQLLTYQHQEKKSSDPSPADVIALNAEGLGKLGSKLKTKFSCAMLEARVDGADQVAILRKLQQGRVMNIDAQIVR